MTRLLSILSLLLFLSACSKMDDKPASGNDSLLAKRMDVVSVPEAQLQKDTNSGLLVDQSRFRTPEHEAKLQRFDPIQLAKIYHAFGEIRKPGITEAQINAFTKEKKITVDELKAILEEGDRLGWGKH